MIDKVLAIVAPHYCCGCGLSGAVLCDSCINNIVMEPFEACAVCMGWPAGSSGVCMGCRPPYARIWVGGVHEGALDSAIDALKFESARAAADDLARLMAERLPQLPETVVIVPIPTIAGHVRERGFDHMKLFARRLAKLKSVSYSTSLLTRKTASVQRGATAKQRVKQAKEAFEVRSQVDPDAIYLLVDDVMTTGSTLKYAAKALREAGATEVWVAVIARQVLS